MRVIFVAVVAALTLTATCDIVAAEASKTSTLTTTDESLSARGFRGVNNNRRSLKSRNEELDSDDLDASEERAFEEILKVEERALANAKYRRWYKADLKPRQVRKMLGVDQSLRKTQRKLSRLYLGYYSYYTHMQRKHGSSDKD
ncbi:hypothetical protein PRNP1_005557 [Phytophthora ramorum]